MKVWGLFYGGANYRQPEYSDAEEFASIKEAEEIFWRRTDFDPAYPALTDDCHMMLYVAHPESEIWHSDPLPDWNLTIGPRGGVKREKL